METLETTEIQTYKSRPWFSLWWDVWTLPGTETFRSLLTETNGGAGRGFMWIIFSGVITSVVYAIMMFLFPSVALKTVPIGNLQMVQTTAIISNFICIPISSVIGIAITAGIYRFLAGLFGGRGEWGRMVFCFAAIQAPLALVMLVTSLPLSVISQTKGALASTNLLLVVFSALLSVALSIYALAQYIFAVKAVENIGTFRAILVVLLPGILTLAVAGCLFGGAIATALNRLPIK